MKHAGFSRLGAEVAAELDRAVVTELAPTGDGPRRAARPAMRRRLRPAAAFAAVSFVGALTVAAFSAGTHHRGPSPATATDKRTDAFTFAVEASSAAASPQIGDAVPVDVRGLALQFSDGSRVALEPKTQARVVRSTADGATVLLERGRLAASVVHRERTSWSFEAGPYAVSVTGTAFDLTWDPRSENFGLHMTEGSVVVHGCGAETWRARGGEDLNLACDEAAGVSTSVVRDTTPATAVASALPAPPSCSHARRTMAGAAAPRVRAAPPPSLPAVDASAAPASPLETMSADLLWQAAQAAREKNAGETKTDLLVFRRRFPDDPRTRLAAFQLGAFV